MDITTGAAFGYRHLFIILFSTFLATLLQILALKLGVVANADLASQCKKSLHPVLNVALWLSAEIAIMATDVAEVIGSAFALNLIFGLPIWAGVLITIFDVLLIVIGLQKHLSHLEAVLSCFLLLVFGCLITILVKSNPVVKDLLIGLLPLDPTVITDQQGLYLSIGLIGATVMPHSLFLGSHLSQHHFEESVLRKLQSRDPISDDQLTHNILERTVHELDEELGHDSHDDEELDPSSPSFASSSSSSASNCTDMVVAPTPHTHHPHPSESQFDDSELVRQTSDFLFHSKLALWISLSVACLVNCAILAVAAANFYGVDQVVDGLSLAFEILRNGLGQSWAILFAISLLLSGQSATITSTIAGAVVMDGFLNLRMKPWVRRLLTRSFVILPSLFVAFYDGVDGLNKLLVFSQVVLSIQLPFSIAPLVRFTSDPELMGPFVNDSLTKWTAYTIASVLCFFNILVIFL